MNRDHGLQSILAHVQQYRLFSSILIFLLITSMVSCSTDLLRKNLSKDQKQTHENAYFLMLTIDAPLTTRSGQLIEHDFVETVVSQSPEKQSGPEIFKAIVIQRNEPLRPGDSLTIPQVPRLTDIHVTVTFRSKKIETATCQSETLDLTRVREESTRIKMSCSSQTNPDETIAIIEPLISVSKSVDLNLEFSTEKRIEALFARINSGGLFMQTSAMWAEQRARAEIFLSQLSAQSKENDSRENDQYIIQFEVYEENSRTSLVTAHRTTDRGTLEAFLSGSKKFELEGNLNGLRQNADALEQTVTPAQITLEAEYFSEIMPPDASTQSVKSLLNKAAQPLKANQFNYALSLIFEAQNRQNKEPLVKKETTRFLFLSSNLPSAITKVRIASYNVENFWDDVDENTSEALKYEDFSSATSNYIQTKQPETKARHVAHALSLAGTPDIVGLQEIESAENKSRTLEILTPQLKALGYEYFVLGLQSADKPVSVTTAFISRFPIVLNESLRIDFEPEGLDEAKKAELRLSARDPQVVEIELPQKKRVRIYNSHWKSKRGDAEISAQMRLAFARLIRSDIEIQKKLNPELDIIVLGDLNTEYKETNILGADGLGQTGDKRLMIGSETTTRLYNLWFDMKEEDRCSYAYSGFRNCIDQILVTDTLYDKNALQIVDGSFRAIGRQGGLAEAILLGADGTPFSWQTKTELDKNNNKTLTHVGQGYSDHLPLVADFVLLTSNNITKLTREELNPAAFSTSDEAPQTDLPERVPACGPQDTFITIDDSFDPWLPQNLKKCVKLEFSENSQGVILRTGLFQVGVQARQGATNGGFIGLTMTRGFDANQDTLRNVIQNSAGDSVRFFKGRLGWADGMISIFADNIEEDVSIIPFEKPCASEADITHSLHQVLAQDLAQAQGPLQTKKKVNQAIENGICVGFTGAMIDVTQNAPRQARPEKSVKMGVLRTHEANTITTTSERSNDSEIELFVPEHQAQEILPEKGQYKISGFSTLIVLKSGKKILQTRTNGRFTGSIFQTAHPISTPAKEAPRFH